MDTFSATESYLSMLLSLPNLQPMTVLAVFFLTLARIVPIVSLAPFLGSRNVPGTIRIMFSVALVALFLPQNLLVVQKEIFFSTSYIWYFLKEGVIGFILGLLATVPFLIAQMAGSLVDFQRGAASLQVTDPSTQTQTGPVGQLCNFVLIALFFTMDGPFLYLNGVADSYRLIPANAAFNPALFNLNSPFWPQMVGAIGMMMRIATQLSAPALIGILLTDLFLGIANRLAPQVQVVFLGIALKSWVGLALLTAAWTLILQVMSKEAYGWFQMLNSIIQQVGQSYVKS